MHLCIWLFIHSEQQAAGIILDLLHFFEVLVTLLILSHPNNFFLFWFWEKDKDFDKKYTEHELQVIWAGSKNLQPNILLSFKIRLD